MEEWLGKQEIFSSLQEALEGCLGEGTQVIGWDGVPGGDAGASCALTLQDGRRVFCKLGGEEIYCEALGLSALQESGCLSTPKILALGKEKGRAFLLQPFLKGTPRADMEEEMGRQLALHHRYVYPKDSFFYPGKDYGFIEDNYIGLGRQINTPMDSWIRFFGEKRLAYQFRLAEDELGEREKRQRDYLLGHLDQYLTEPEHPSLLHGDLWAGNVMAGPDGHPLFIDPAVSFGHREADLAMSELFGGFGPRFYAAYEEVYPLEPGYEDRRDLYNLYHLLNHLNLFGDSYLYPVRRILRRYGAG